MAENERERMDSTGIRAGSTEHVVRYVLGVSLVLAIAAMAIVALAV